MSSKRENRYKERAYLEILTSAPAQTSGADTMETRYNGAVYNEVFGVTNDFFTPVIVKYMERNLVISEQVLPVAWPDLATERERHLTTGKRAERTKLDSQCLICRSATGQASCLICAHRRQLTFPFCC